MKRAIVFLSLLFLSICPAYAQSGSSLFHFAGNMRSYRKIHGGIEARLDNGAVRVVYLKDIGFRVRYSFTGKFQKLFSYATVENNPPAASVSIRNEGSTLMIKGPEESVIVQKKPFRLSFANQSGHVFLSEDEGAGHQGDKIVHIFKKSPHTLYYGLGERPENTMIRNNQTYELWNSDHPSYQDGSEPLYEAYPFYIGMQSGKAFGVFYDNTYKTMFDFGAQLKQDIAFHAAGGQLCFYVFSGPQISKILEEYTNLTGRMHLPPKWALGYQQSRWGYYPDKELERLAYEFRSRGIPCDAFYLDIDYMNGYRIFTWDKRFFPHPSQMLSDLKKKGFKVVTIIDPGVKTDSSYSVYTSGLKDNVYVKLPNGSNYLGDVWPGQVVFPDFSNPKTRVWWGEQFKGLIDDGVSGIWLDMNEPSNFMNTRGTYQNKTIPNITVFNKDGIGASALEMHNLYGMNEAMATYKGLRKLEPNKRPFIITRAAYSGIQRYSSMWTGDNTANWTNVSFVEPLVMSVGLAGEPFAGFDIGGFVGSPTGEMYMRFLQIGVLMPFTRTHTERNSVSQSPWNYGRMYEFINKAAIRLRYKLLPYIYTTFYESTQSGSPVVRPLFWKYQQDPKTWYINDQFMLGDHLLAAPVVKKGMNTRTLYLPHDTWYGFFNNKRYEGGKEITVNAPIQAINTYTKEMKHPLAGLPLFAEAGSVIPMQKVLQYVGQEHIDTLKLRTYVGGSTKSEIYQDDGESFNYEHGAYQVTHIQSKDSGSSFDLTFDTKGHYDGAASNYKFNVYGLTQKPGEVTVDGKSVMFSYDAGSNSITFTTPSTIKSVHIEK